MPDSSHLYISMATYGALVVSLLCSIYQPLLGAKVSFYSLLVWTYFQMFTYPYFYPKFLDRFKEFYDKHFVKFSYLHSYSVHIVLYFCVGDYVSTYIGAMIMLLITHDLGRLDWNPPQNANEMCFAIFLHHMGPIFALLGQSPGDSFMTSLLLGWFWDIHGFRFWRNVFFYYVFGWEDVKGEKWRTLKVMRYVYAAGTAICHHLYIRKFGIGLNLLTLAWFAQSLGRNWAGYNFWRCDWMGNLETPGIMLNCVWYAYYHQFGASKVIFALVLFFVVKNQNQNFRNMPDMVKNMFQTYEIHKYLVYGHGHVVQFCLQFCVGETIWKYLGASFMVLIIWNFGVPDSRSEVSWNCAGVNYLWVNLLRIVSVIAILFQPMEHTVFNSLLFGCLWHVRGFYRIFNIDLKSPHKQLLNKFLPNHFEAKSNISPAAAA